MMATCRCFNEDTSRKETAVTSLDPSTDAKSWVFTRREVCHCNCHEGSFFTATQNTTLVGELLNRVIRKKSWPSLQKTLDPKNTHFSTKKEKKIHMMSNETRWTLLGQPTAKNGRRSGHGASRPCHNRCTTHSLLNSVRKANKKMKPSKKGGFSFALPRVFTQHLRRL
jgi:hypothetical protein